jgi:hypothetical protein
MQQEEQAQPQQQHMPLLLKLYALGATACLTMSAFALLAAPSVGVPFCCNGNRLSLEITVRSPIARHFSVNSVFLVQQKTRKHLRAPARCELFCCFVGFGL